MKNHLNDSLICQQIDVAVMGSKSLQIIQALLQTSFESVTNNQSSTYLKYLKSIYNQNSQISPKKPNRIIKPQKNNHKFNTNICTQSFWLQFSFYQMDQKAYDPLIAPILKNAITICIIADGQDDQNSSQLKNLISRKNTVCDSSKQNSIGLYSEQILSTIITDTSKNHNTKTRNQLLMQTKILNRMYEMHINQFSSVLALKLFDNGRVVEETNNLRLNRNQILRWIVDRHFQNVYHIKLNQQLTDQLQTQYVQPSDKNCQLI